MSLLDVDLIDRDILIDMYQTYFHNDSLEGALLFKNYIENMYEKIPADKCQKYYMVVTPITSGFDFALCKDGKVVLGIRYEKASMWNWASYGVKTKTYIIVHCYYKIKDFLMWSLDQYLYGECFHSNLIEYFHLTESQFNNFINSIDKIYELTGGKIGTSN